MLVYSLEDIKKNQLVRRQSLIADVQLFSPTERAGWAITETLIEIRN